LGVLVFAVAPGVAGQAAPSSGVAKQSDAIVGAYRKIIVLMDGAGALDPGVKERAATAGRILFQENQERLATLEEELEAAVSKGNVDPANEFLDRLERNPEYRDGDKLASRDLLEGLAATVDKSDVLLTVRIGEDLHALGRIQLMYQREIGEIWERYKRAE
jgi:hypothetical protein